MFHYTSLELVRSVRIKVAGTRVAIGSIFVPGAAFIIDQVIDRQGHEHG